MMNEIGFDIPMVSLAKRDEEIYTTESSTPICLPKDNPGLRLLIRVRDESHRFAVTFHRLVRSKGYKSVLESLDGVGKTRLNLIYKHLNLWTRLWPQRLTTSRDLTASATALP